MRPSRKNIIRILVTSMSKIKEEEIRQRLGSASKAECVWINFQLLFLGRTTRMGENKCPRMLLKSTHNGQLCRGVTLVHVRDVFVDGSSLSIDGVDLRGDLKD